MSIRWSTIISAFLLALIVQYEVHAQQSGSDTSALEEIVRYTFSGGVLTGAVILTPRGEEVRREFYIRDSEGRIVEIRNQFPDGRSSRIGGAQGREWFEYPGGERIYRVYLQNGDLESEELRRGSVLVSKTTYTYQDDFRTPSVVEEIRPVEGLKRRTEYGERGLPLRELLSTSDGLETISSYEWDGRGRPTGIRILEGRNERSVRFLYGEDGSETEERTDTTGALILRMLKKPDGTLLEERFDGGVLFAKTFFKDGRRIREEIYLDGVLVRLREIP